MGLTLHDPGSIENMFGNYGDTHFSKSKKYAAIGVYRNTVSTDEVAYFYSPGNYLNYMLLDMPSPVCITDYIRDSQYALRLVTRSNLYDLPSNPDRKNRRRSAEVYVFRVEEIGYVLDHIEHHNDEKGRIFIPALARRISEERYQIPSYTCEVLNYAYPSNVGGAAEGPIHIELQANYVEKFREFCGVGDDGVGQYILTTKTTHYYSNKSAAITLSGSITGTSTGIFTSRDETEIFGKTIVTRDDEINATYIIGASSKQAIYVSSSEVRRIAHVIPEIGLFVYVHQKAVYEHASSVLETDYDLTRSPSTSLAVFEESALVIECGETQITIDAPVYDDLVTYSGIWSGLIAALGDVRIGPYEYNIYGTTTVGGTGSPLYPGRETIFDFGGKQYLASTGGGGFTQINGIGGFSIVASHCFMPETGGVCLHISVPQGAVTTERSTYYFLYDDEAGLREMPAQMQDAILESLELTPGTLPPKTHMAQI